MRILVIGGGISGLAVAIALARTGHKVTVYERQPAIKEVGAGLTIWPNAIRVLRQLGMSEMLPTLGMPAHYRTIQTWRGELLSCIHVDQVAGSPIQVMHRADLQGALFQTLAKTDATVELGKRCVGFTQETEGVRASFADGTTAEGDLLIGADGIRSIIRQHLFGEPQIHYVGYSSWRGIASVSKEIIPFGVSSETWGVGRRIGLIPLKDDRVYWFVARTVPEGEGKDDPPELRKQRVQALFHGWHHPIEPVLEATEASMIIHADIYTIAPLPRWSKGRVVLIGDAAHAMTPNMGQGGCQAIEDAPALAESLQAHTSDSEAALRAYEVRRMSRVRRVIKQSERIGRLSQVNNALLYSLRNTLVKALYTRALTSELIWLLR
ncbi:MAG: FAD-dependent oxidoreductase [Ktedonobacteraceae bacterium]|nr:FAD-dependent oxidoreductase [Ktedonobacteraceae bacterium]